MIRYFLNGVECNPVNKDDVEYIFDFTERRARTLELSVDTLEFVKEDYDAIKTYQSTWGKYVGMPLDIQYSNGTTIQYLLDFSEDSYTERDRSCSVKLKRYRGSDNFSANADGLSFRAIQWQPSDFRMIDYVVIPDDQFIYFISLSLATFSLAQELAKSIQEIAEGIADIVKASVPVGVPPVPDWGAIAVASIKLAARIAYTLFIIVALVQVIQQLLNVIFPNVRQFKGITVKRLLEKSCNYLGYTLQSTLLNQLDQLVICPVPLREKDPSLWVELFAPMSLAYTEGFPTARDTVQTPGQVITAVEDIFNAKTVVNDGIVRIEQELTYEQQAVQGVPLAFNLQEQLQNEHRLNTVELYKRKVCLYQIDGSDVNTMDDTKKTVFEVSSELENTQGINYELIKGVDFVNIPFARGTRKGSLTFVEAAAKVLAQAVDLFTGGNLSAQINDRKNVMQVSSQYFSVTKLLWMNGTKLHPNQNAFIGADVIVNQYHASRFIENNQKDVYEQMPIALTESEIFNILQNNFVILNNGQTAEIKRVNWSERRHMAMIDFTVRREAVNEKTIVLNEG
jgi:hypothetical protein